MELAVDYVFSSLCSFAVAVQSGSNPIRGFLMQAWDPSNTPIGTFVVTDGMKLLDCTQFSSIAAMVSNRMSTAIT